MRPTVMEVDLNNFKDNIRNIKNYIGNKDIMPVIKANGYGTYINKRIDIINEFNIVAVAIVDEAVELRRLGYNKDIFILNQPYIGEIDSIIENDIVFGLSSFDFLKELVKIDRRVRVHLEIETGMNRTGININDLDIFIKNIKTNSNIVIEGVYTHFSSADSDRDYTNGQIDVFKSALEIVKDNFDTIKYVHTEASNGILNFNLDFTNLVRPGIVMHGYDSFDGASDLITTKPVCKLKSKITFLKEVSCGEYIGYSKSYMTTRKSKIATVPIGYADGISRILSNRGYVVINGKKAPVVGKVCMDSILINVTDINDVQIYDDVYLWDNDIVKLSDVAELCDTSNYEVISRISYRVPRIFIGCDK